MSECWATYCSIVVKWNYAPTAFFSGPRASTVFHAVQSGFCNLGPLLKPPNPKKNFPANIYIYIKLFLQPWACGTASSAKSRK